LPQILCAFGLAPSLARCYNRPVEANMQVTPPSREQLVHLLYEAAELEHTLMCTYLYAAFSLRSGPDDGLAGEEAEAVARWQKVILRVAIEEMAHLSAVWNITAALGGAPRFGRGNFPLDAGLLPAGIVVKLVPFGEAALQHFIHLERPEGSGEAEGSGFEASFPFTRAIAKPRLTPMPVDYETVGTFYALLGSQLEAFVAAHGEALAFCGNPALQLSESEVGLAGVRPVICLKTALAAFKLIVAQGEGAALESADSHYQRFLAIRTELAAIKANNPTFSPAYPAAHNPVLRRPMHSTGRVFIEDEVAAQTVDLANSGYGLMLRLLAYAFTLERPSPEKALVLDLSRGLMRAVTLLGERAARLPSGSTHPDCNAGMSFTTLRDAAPLLPGDSARRFLIERLAQLAEAARELTGPRDARLEAASRQLTALSEHATRELSGTRPLAQLKVVEALEQNQKGLAPANVTPPAPTRVGKTDEIEGEKLTLLYEGPKCIHARFCVTGAPKVFLANVQGPWIHPDAMDAEELVAIAHACPSGAIRYRRKDGRPDETAPPVNLISVREAGPYAVRGDLRIAGEASGFRATLCRCGASKNKPYCDGSHHDVAFSASGEPKTGAADMLPVRDGALEIAPLSDGPLQVRGNIEITSGTGRVVARLTSARLCRCGASANKPFCDGTHAQIGFRSDV
jgi:CDGSH-type Zn-finger protein/uncharacterized Fe-S cluster protein YjdI